MNKKTKVVSGFPGIGKTTAFNQMKVRDGVIVLDSDSSHFSWSEPGVRDQNFPNNYMEHIKSNIGKADYIFVSSHDNVREALEFAEIEYTLVYPGRSLKDEYIQNYKDRGNDEGFIKFIGENWDEFIGNIESETYPELIELKSGEHLANIL